MDNQDRMTLMEAIRARHSVRKYLHKPLPDGIVTELRQAIDRYNSEGGLDIQLVTNETRAFTGLLSYGSFSGVENYLAMVAPRDKKADRLVGYYGERLVLLAQQLGLNTCWVGLSYRKTKAYKVPDGMHLACMIALGYGADQGKTHKIKTPEQVSNITPASPEWFRRGVEAALLAPTAINQQKFHFTLTDSVDSHKLPIVEASAGFSLAGYTRIDLGIAMTHFEIGAGDTPFKWEVK